MFVKLLVIGILAVAFLDLAGFLGAFLAAIRYSNSIRLRKS